MKTTTNTTNVYRNFHGIVAETTTAETGNGWKITTMKRSNGMLVSDAQKVTFLPGGNFTFTLGDKNIQLLSLKVKATEKAIREQHAKALILFDEHEDIREEANTKAYEIKVGQRLFLDGYGKSQFDGNAIIYAIEETQYGTNYLTVDTDTLQLSVSSYIRDYELKFGIGTYYIKGDVFKGTQDELNNFVLEAKSKEAKANQREESNNLLVSMARAGKVEEGRKIVKVPSNAVSVIVAELMQDESDIQADYFHSSTVKTIYLAFSPHKKDLFSEMRKACLNSDNEDIKAFAIPRNVNNNGETKEDYVSKMRDYYKNDNEAAKNWNPADEHREKYSMGSGYYLGEPYSRSGWRISKSCINLEKCEDLYISAIEGRYFCDAKPPIKDNAEPKEKIAISGNFEIVDYSEKALALFGDTKSIKEELKAIGGRFNARLKYEDTTKCGWIFPKTKLSEIEKLLKK